MVSVLSFYYDDPSSNPAEAYSFFLQDLCLKRTKIHQKEAGSAHLKKVLSVVDVVLEFKKNCPHRAANSRSRAQRTNVQCDTTWRSRRPLSCFFFQNGPFPAIFSLFLSFQNSWQRINEIFCQWLDLNLRPLVSEVTTLPTESQPQTAPWVGSFLSPSMSFAWVHCEQITHSLTQPSKAHLHEAFLDQHCKTFW